MKTGLRKQLKAVTENTKEFHRRLKRQSHNQYNDQGYPRRKGSGKLGLRRRLKLIQREIDTGIPFGTGEKWAQYQKRLKVYREMYPGRYKEKIENGDTIQSDLPNVR